MLEMGSLLVKLVVLKIHGLVRICYRHSHSCLNWMKNLERLRASTLRMATVSVGFPLKQTLR